MLEDYDLKKIGITAVILGVILGLIGCLVIFGLPSGDVITPPNGNSNDNGKDNGDNGNADDGNPPPVNACDSCASGELCCNDTCKVPSCSDNSDCEEEQTCENAGTCNAMCKEIELDTNFVPTDGNNTSSLPPNPDDPANDVVDGTGDTAEPGEVAGEQE